MFAASKTSAVATGSPPPATDPQFNYVTMLLHGDGTNGAQNNTFVDSSTNNFTITRNGTPTQGSFSPYGTLWSNYFGGSQFLTAPSNAAFGFGTGDFTIETWAYFAGVSTQQNFIDLRSTAGSTAPILYITATGVVNYSVGGAALISSASNAVPANTWNHIALSRSSGSSKIFVNGTQVGSTAADSTNFGTTIAAIGGVFNSTNTMTGYLSNVRIVKGTAVYTSAFTPSTTPLTAVSGTSLLTCQSNRFRDASSNNFAITVTGTPSVQRFSPFDPAAEYSTSVIGGSGYFGTSNYLSFTGVNAAFQFGTGDWTIETWAYATTIQAQRICDFRPSSNGAYPTVGMNSSGQFDYTAMAAIRITGTTIAKPNTWYHVAVCRSGTSTRLFVNGVQEGVTYTDSTNYTVASGRPIIAADGFSIGSSAWVGYLSDVRMLKGTALYTTTFTPPTAPLTAITNTSLLLNTVNAGIFDNAMMNDLVTVGNAQVSTAVVKYGTGSLAFDGTGDWLTFVDSPNVQLGSGDFTIEGWVNLSLLGSARGIFSKGTSTTGLSLAVNALNQVVFNYTASSLTGTTVLMATTWYHIAVVRSGSATGNVKIFINGTADATSGGAITDNFNQTNAGYIGADRVGTSPMNGYIDDLRITKGVARYTANFTPPTAAFPNN